MLTPEQIRAARAMLRWEQKRLAEAAEISLETVKRLESMDRKLSANLSTVQSIKTTLEAAGIEFIDGTAPGVRLRLGIE